MVLSAMARRFSTAWMRGLVTILAAAAASAAWTGPGRASDFNWGPSLGTINTGAGTYTLSGLGYTSPVENQGSWGTCWDFAGVAPLESKYRLTRNDTAYAIDLSEEQVPMQMGGTYGNFYDGGYDSWVMSQVCTGGGLVQASELPYNANYPNYLPPAGDWPMHPGWQNRSVVATNWAFLGGSVAGMKSALTTYGPGTISLDNATFFYYPDGSSSTDATGSPNVGINHEVSVVGWHDATSADNAAIQAAGGYWIIENSWGTGWFNYGGYGFIPYNLVTSGDFYTGPAYYTSAMATATWQGSSNTWSAGANNWTSSGSAYSWVNQETAAIFNASAHSSITISGPAIAHSLTFNPGATGYVFSGGSLTVTAGGITANESVTINSSITIGAPQTWTTAAGKSLLINGNVSTVISTLTVGGAGTTTINGVIGNGGALTGIGGNLVMQGPGTLYLTASNTYSGTTLVSGGLLDLAGAGAISSTAAMTLVGGTLLLDNTLVNNSARIPPSVPVVLSGGELSLTGNTTLATAQSIGTVSLQQGQSTITANPVTAPAQWSTAAFSRGAGATLLVRGPSLGSGGSGAVGQIIFSSTPTLSNNGSGTAVGILPYVFGDNSPTGNGTDLVTYNSTYGVCLLSSSQYSSSVTANTNVKLASSPAAINSNTSILALVLTNTGEATSLSINSGKSLTLTSGALLSTGSAANSITGGAITFGTNSATNYEGVVYTASNLTLGSAVTNNGSNLVLLTKSGPAMLSFSGANTYSGGTTVTAGTLQVAAGGSLVSAGAVNVGGGNSPVFNVSGGTVSTSNSGNAIHLGGIAGQTGVVTVSAGNVATTNGGETVMLGDYGTGIWNQSGGTTTVANQLSGANQIGSAGQLNVSGGYLSAGNCILLAQRGNGTMNLTGGMVTTPWLAMVGWNYGEAAATVNLNGGTLAVGGVNENYSGQSASGMATFNFNGGLLRATASNAAFMQGLDFAYVQSGGAPIDTQGYNITVGQQLQTGTTGIDGGLTKYGAGTLTLLASNTYTGPTTAYGGLQLGDGSANTGSVAGNIALMNSATLTFADPAALTYAYSISGTGNLVKTGTGSLVLSGTSTYSGTTTVNGGMLAFSTSASMPAGTVVSINGGAAVAATPLYSPASWLSSGAIAATSSGALALTANCAQNLNFQSPTTYASLSLGSSGSNTYSGTLMPADTTYRLGGGGGTLTMTQPLTGGYNLAVNGPGGVVLANAAGLSMRSLQMNTAAGPAALQLTAGSYSVGPLAVYPLAGGGGGAASLVLGNAVNGTATILSVGGDNSSSTFGGAIGDLWAVNHAATGGLTKAGSGTLLLTGNSSYSGPTVVSNGTLRLNSGMSGFGGNGSGGCSTTARAATPPRYPATWPRSPRPTVPRRTPCGTVGRCPWLAVPGRPVSRTRTTRATAPTAAHLCSRPTAWEPWAEPAAPRGSTAPTDPIPR